MPNLKVGVVILGDVPLDPPVEESPPEESRPEGLPPEFEAVIARIEVPQRIAFTPPPGLTGELARLLSWWISVSDGTAPRVTALTSRADLTDVVGAVVAGGAAADRACDEGATLIVPRAHARQPVAALAVIGSLTRTEASAITYQPAGMTDREWIERCAAVRDACVDVADLRAAPIELLGILNAPHIAFVVGALLASAARKTASIVEGTDELAAALIADRLSFRAKEWWRSGSTSPDPARRSAVDRLAVDTGLPLALIDDEGFGADATVSLLQLLCADGD